MPRWCAPFELERQLLRVYLHVRQSTVIIITVLLSIQLLNGWCNSNGLAHRRIQLRLVQEVSGSRVSRVDIRF